MPELDLFKRVSVRSKAQTARYTLESTRLSVPSHIDATYFLSHEDYAKRFYVLLIAAEDQDEVTWNVFKQAFDDAMKP